MRKVGSGDVLSWLLSLAVAVVLVGSVWVFADDTERANASVPPTPVTTASAPTPEVSLATVRLPPPPVPPVAPAPEPAARRPPAPPPVSVTPLKPRPVVRAAMAARTGPVIEPLRPTPRPRRAAPIPEPDSAPATELAVDAGAVAEGRTLLRLLEHGEGPSIEIAWPGGAASRARLYRHLRACLGMRVAVMDARNRVFLASGPAGTPTELNLDRISGFMRSPAGRMTSAERRLISTIRARHGVRDAAAIRLFPRRVDANLLGGLNLAIGDRYRAARNIRARYLWAGNRLYVGGIRVDGSAVAGRIPLACVRSA